MTFGDRPSALKRVAKLPVEQQLEFAASGQVPPAQTAGRRSKDHVEPHHRDDPNPVLMAAVANPRDVAETILAMVKANGDTVGLVQRLLPELKHLLESRRERQYVA